MFVSTQLLQSSAANYVFCFWGSFHRKKSVYLADIIELNFTILILNNEALALPAEIVGTESLNQLFKGDRSLHSSLSGEFISGHFHLVALTLSPYISFVLIKHDFRKDSQSASEYVKLQKIHHLSQHFFLCLRTTTAKNHRVFPFGLVSLQVPFPDRSKRPLVMTFSHGNKTGMETNWPSSCSFLLKKLS